MKLLSLSKGETWTYREGYEECLHTEFGPLEDMERRWPSDTLPLGLSTSEKWEDWCHNLSSTVYSVLLQWPIRQVHTFSGSIHCASFHLISLWVMCYLESSWGMWRSLQMTWQAFGMSDTVLVPKWNLSSLRGYCCSHEECWISLPRSQSPSGSPPLYNFYDLLLSIVTWQLSPPTPGSFCS